MKSNLHFQDCVPTEQDNIIHSIVQCNKSNINVIHRRVCNKTFFYEFFQFLLNESLHELFVQMTTLFNVIH